MCVCFFPSKQVDLSVWPAAQAVNFYVVPGQYRVAYVSFVALLWNVFLSYISHKVGVQSMYSIIHTLSSWQFSYLFVSSAFSWEGRGHTCIMTCNVSSQRKVETK